MYLAKTRHGGVLSYTIRKSVFDAELDIYTHRDIFDLGTNPAKFIEHLGGSAICFAEQLEDAVAQATDSDSTLILEELLWDFIPHEVRQVINQFQRKDYAALSPLSASERQEIEKSIHIFDRRRLFYIRYGAVDQGRIYRVNEKLYRPLLFKSRDEKEQYIQNLEKALRPGELKKYVFVIFNLQQSFSENYAAYMPEALEEERMVDIFLDELCRLNRDQSFWQDNVDHQFLRKDLQFYLTSFFDFNFARRSFEYDFYRAFERAHRKFAWPDRKPKITEEETSKIFGRSMAELKGLKPDELRKLFRNLAKEHHPDTGGLAEDFIKLRDAFESVKMASRKKE